MAFSSHNFAATDTDEVVVTQTGNDANDSGLLLVGAVKASKTGHPLRLTVTCTGGHEGEYFLDGRTGGTIAMVEVGAADIVVTIKPDQAIRMDCSGRFLDTTPA